MRCSGERKPALMPSAQQAEVRALTHYGAFFAVDRATGKLLWRYPMSELRNYPTYGVASSPAVDHGFVYFGGLDGTFYAFRQGG
jgi:outer membrane protein assembly factor BamB